MTAGKALRQLAIYSRAYLIERRTAAVLKLRPVPIQQPPHLLRQLLRKCHGGRRRHRSLCERLEGSQSRLPVTGTCHC